MTSNGKYFIAAYTNEVKDYCDKKFFTRLHTLSKNCPVHIVDNTEEQDYYNKCRRKFSYENFTFYHLAVDIEPRKSLFQRRVTESVLLLREKFLATNYPYFLIIESDVIPSRRLLKKLDKTISTLDSLDRYWGILGGLYHLSFHNYKLEGIQQTYHALSGCSVYKRSLIEKYPFRWSEENMGAFPDAWICYDAKKEYTFYNDHNISCKHLENKKTGTRYSKALPK